jgi:arylsulfatase A-like enzyme
LQSRWTGWSAGFRLLAAVALAVLVPAGLACERLGRERPRNIVLVIVDTLRADHLSHYGYVRETMPLNRERLRDAQRFEACVSPMPLTDAAIASILTGLDPTRHGIRSSTHHLSADSLTLAEILAPRMATAAFFSRAALTPERGWDQGFAHFDNPTEHRFRDWTTQRAARSWQRTADEVTDAALGWLEARPGDEPFFLLVHYFDPHAQYDPPAPFRGRFEPESTTLDEPLTSWWGTVTDIERVRARYDEEILAVDHHLDRLLSFLEQSQIWDETLFVLTSDHGESLGERGKMDHGEWLYEEQVRVPLFVRNPKSRRTPKEISSIVGLIDLAPTILELLGVDVPEMEGQSLAPLLAGEPSDARSYLVESEPCVLHDTAVRIGMDCYPPGLAGKLRGIRNARWKLIVTPQRRADALELFDLTSDPGEEVNLAERESEHLEALRDELAERFDLSAVSFGWTSPETRRRLRELGYVE